ncbi:MAG: sulfotransferase domain-containing protein, partial [Chthoniobacteraceae bacterium]
MPVIPTKVDFVICGAQKGGTSALDAYLRDHPQICMAAEKELHFFDNEDHFRENTPDYAVYHSSFSPAPHHELLGEATPSYIYWHGASGRMRRYNAEMKLIVLLRNPVERAFSHWNMERSRNLEHLSFWDALQNEGKRCRAALPYQERGHSYMERGFYANQLRRLWTWFSKNQVLVLKSEDLKNKAIETLQTTCEFLQVAPFETIEIKDMHALPYAAPMGEREREFL